jgi:hypothetical protein
VAIARCQKCGKPSASKPPTYDDTPFRAFGDPHGAIVCGKKGCEGDASIWLKLDEAQNYRAGQRVFELPTRSAKVRLQ